MVFFTELIKKPVIDSTGTVLGHLMDLVFIDGVEAAQITHLVYLAKDGYKKKLSWSCVEGIRKSSSESSVPSVLSVLSIALNVSQTALEPTFVREQELLAHDLLDKQIIDVTGVKVVRVNDLLMSKVGDAFCITGVCVGFTSFFRRLSIKPAFLNKALLNYTKEKIILWKSVEPLEPQKHLHLKESKNKIAEMHPGDIADLMEELSPKEQILIFNTLDKKTAAKTLVEAQPEIQESFFRGLKINRIVELLESMPAHNVVDLLGILEKEKAAMILTHLSPEKAKMITELRKYPENTAGALMRTDVFTLSDEATAQGALAMLRKMKPSADKTHVLLIVDKEKHLAGTISLRTLLNAPLRKKLKDFMKKHPVAFGVYTPKQDIATALEKYNYFMIPIVNENGVLLGMVTADAVLSKVIPQSWIRRNLILTRVRKKQKNAGHNEMNGYHGGGHEKNS